MSSVTEKQFDQFKDLPPWSQQGLRLKGKRGSRSKKRNSLPPEADCLFLFIRKRKNQIKNIFTPLNPTNVGHLTGAENPVDPVK